MLNSEPGPLGSSQNEEKNPFPGWGGEDQAADHAHPPPTAHVTTLRGSSLELSIGQHHSPVHRPPQIPGRSHRLGLGLETMPHLCLACWTPWTLCTFYHQVPRTAPVFGIITRTPIL